MRHHPVRYFKVFNNK